jgi:hypothetical protein
LLSTKAGAPSNFSSPRLGNSGFSIEQGQFHDHNTHIVATWTDYAEAGLLARLLTRMPILEQLATPSAPDPRFFSAPAPLLRTLSVRAGYDHQNFLEHLAGAKNLPALRSLEYGEGSGAGFEDFRHAEATAYLQLCRSPQLQLRALVLHNPALSDDECAALKLSSPATQILIVRASRAYVRAKSSPIGVG